MKKIIYFIFLLFFISNKNIYSQISKKNILFDPYKSKKIENYKEVDLNNFKYLLDNYLLNIKEVDFKNIFKIYNNSIDLKKTKENPLKISLNYGNVIFKNKVQEGDELFKYNLIGYSKPINSFLINMDMYEDSNILILNTNKYDYFEIAGIPYFSNKNDYFVTYKEYPEFKLFEFYKINNNKIIHINNFYTEKYNINKICWNNNFILLEIIDKNKKRWVKININDINNL